MQTIEQYQKQVEQAERMMNIMIPQCDEWYVWRSIKEDAERAIKLFSKPISPVSLNHIKTFYNWDAQQNKK